MGGGWRRRCPESPSGYPQGLKGEEILLEARILGVADVMEAMCSHRPYRASLGLAETLDELTRNKGILYDAAVVETCLKLYGQDLPAPGKVSAGPAPLRSMMSLSPVSPGDGARAHEIVPGGRALPQAAAGKTRNWARLRTKGHRSWMHLGSTSIMGWLIMASVRGF